MEITYITSLVEKLTAWALAAAFAWIVKLQRQMGKISTMEDELRELKSLSVKIQTLTEKVSSNDNLLDRRVALTEQILAEIAPLTKNLSVTLTKVTTIVEILMDERKRGE